MMDPIAYRVVARFASAPGLPSRMVLAFLRKVTKGLKGPIDLAVVEQVFKFFGAGWSVEEGLGALNLTDSSHLKFVLKPFCAKYNCEVWGYSGVKEPKEFWFKTQEEAEAAIPALKAEVEKCGPKGPTNPKKDQLYIAKINEEVTQDHAGRWRFEVLGVWYGRPAFTVKTPAGAMQFVLSLSVADTGTSPNNLTSDRFWKLVYQSGAKDMALKILAEFGEEAVDRVLRPSQIRDLTNTGTCPACFGNFKLTASTRRGKDKTMPGMVLHGYKRPGVGYIQGNCFGQDWPPFELSKEGTDVLIASLKGMKERTEDQLKSLRSGEIDTLNDERGSFRGPPQVVKRDEADPQLWARVLERAISKVEAELRYAEGLLKELQKAVQGWKPAPLPG